MRRRWIKTAAGLTILAGAHAHGSGFQVREDNAVSMGASFAGSAVGQSGPATVSDNPAAMTQLPGVQVQLGGSLLLPSSVFHGTATDAFGHTIAGSGDRDAGNPSFVPNGYLTYQLAPRLWAGVGLSSPDGVATTYGADFVGRYQADKTSLITYNLNPGIGYQITDRLSLGAGMSVQYARADFSNFVNASTIATAALGQPASLPDGYFRLRGDDWSFGYNFGALFKPGPLTSIGLAYRSRIQHDFTGTADFLVSQPLSLNPSFRNSGATAKLVLPDTATLSLAQGLGGNWTLLADLSWTNWSQFKVLNAFRSDGTLINTTPEHYDDTFFTALGASYKVDDRLTVRAGTAFDKSPVSNTYRSARIPDQDRIWLSAGASFAVMRNLTVDGAYTHIFVSNSRIDERSSTNDVLVGYFSNSVDIISLGARMRF